MPKVSLNCGASNRDNASRRNTSVSSLTTKLSSHLINNYGPLWQQRSNIQSTCKSTNHPERWAATSLEQPLVFDNCQPAFCTARWITMLVLLNSPKPVSQSTVTGLKWLVTTWSFFNPSLNLSAWACLHYTLSECSHCSWESNPQRSHPHKAPCHDHHQVSLMHDIWKAVRTTSEETYLKSPKQQLAVAISSLHSSHKAFVKHP